MAQVTPDLSACDQTAEFDRAGASGGEHAEALLQHHCGGVSGEAGINRWQCNIEGGKVCPLSA